MDHIRKNQEEINARMRALYAPSAHTYVEKSEDSGEIEKGGPGSGRKIGETPSGKIVYDHFEHEAHKDFTADDHKEAAMVHAKVGKLDPNQARNKKHVEQYRHHQSQKIKHQEAAGLFKKSQTPLEHQEMIKSQIANSIGGDKISEEELTKSANDYFEKGRKGEPIGTVKTFGGKQYIKTANGWRPVGKNKGKYKDAHETVHGKQKKEKINWRDVDYKKQITAEYKGNAITIGEKEGKWYLYINSRQEYSEGKNKEEVQFKAQDILFEKDKKLSSFIGKTVELFEGKKDKILDFGSRKEMYDKAGLKIPANPMGYHVSDGFYFLVERNGQKEVLNPGFGDKLLNK